MTITGIHASFSSPQAQDIRAFLRDVLQWPSTDIGGGFLIFDVPDAELAATESSDVAQDISFGCDDLDATIAELMARKVRFANGIDEMVWGRRTFFDMPGGTRVMLYQPTYTRSARR